MQKCLSQQHALNSTLNCGNLAACSHTTHTSPCARTWYSATSSPMMNTLSSRAISSSMAAARAAAAGVHSGRPVGSAAAHAAAHSQAPKRSGTVHDQQAAALQVAITEAGAHPSSGHHGRSSARHGMSGRRLRRVPNPRWQSPRQRHTAACVWPLRALAHQLPDSHHPPSSCLCRGIRAQQRRGCCGSIALQRQWRSGSPLAAAAAVSTWRPGFTACLPLHPPSRLPTWLRRSSAEQRDETRSIVP